jgi:DNA-binding response OmpR family regulator
MAKLLMVEDDLHVLQAVREILSFDMHQLETATSGSAGYASMQDFQFDLIILDWDLPDISGLELCQKYRWSGGMTPILMLTGKNKAEDKELALDSGADDYVCKPFNTKELRARVRALVRRPPVIRDETIKCCGIVLDPKAFTVTLDGENIKITAKEFALLEYFLRNPNQAFSIEALILRLWPNADECSEEAVRMAIKRLRQKLGERGSMIETLYGAGYTFRPSIQTG